MSNHQFLGCLVGHQDLGHATCIGKAHNRDSSQRSVNRHIGQRIEARAKKQDISFSIDVFNILNGVEKCETVADARSFNLFGKI
ncbi:hypothetical protein WK30_23565 [Burkholderia vietnamiensis]|nr:hypothetical protein WJ57_08340 [Burkholderia vietnamiensis]KVR98450.1 hypothetical protein WK30_23565 [Burkholderia vietnamiensis]